MTKSKLSNQIKRYSMQALQQYFTKQGFSNTHHAPLDMCAEGLLAKAASTVNHELCVLEKFSYSYNTTKFKLRNYFPQQIFSCCKYLKHYGVKHSAHHRKPLLSLTAYRSEALQRSLLHTNAYPTTASHTS